MGLQFENLVLNNREKIFELLNIRIEDILSDIPFLQRQTVSEKELFLIGILEFFKTRKKSLISLDS